MGVQGISLYQENNYLNKTKQKTQTKNAVNNVKRYSTEWEKVCANHISAKGLISRTYKEQQLNNRKAI